jgi:phytoene dehydrogenase-like protein
VAAHSEAYEAVVVGAGPNGLAAAITLAMAGHSVLVVEANESIGGSARSAELTLPGYTHDLCSAVFPLGVGSPFFRRLGLPADELAWIQPEIPLAHPLEAGRTAVLQQSIAQTARGMGADSAAYTRFMEPYVRNWEALIDEVLQPLGHLPRRPFLLARFAQHALRSASGLGNAIFKTEDARALWAGLAAHSFLPLDQVGSAAIGMVLGILGHAVGWPIARGGAQSIPDAMARRLKSMGGEIRTGIRIEHLEELPSSRVVLLNLTPRQILRVAGDRLPSRYARALQSFRYGPAAFKVDYALSQPIPWKSPECRVAGTIHLGGTLAEIAEAERQASLGIPPRRPFVLVAQPSLIDATRAPEGRHTAWAYCHVPHACELDLTARIEEQVERFAPGFRDCIMARAVTTPREFEKKNGNLVGGDINGGLASLRQVMARPVSRLVPYRTPLEGVYLCSASTPPGGGVHGMGGYNAACAALSREFR